MASDGDRGPDLYAIMASDAMRRILATTPGLEPFQHLASDPQALFAELGQQLRFSALVRITAQQRPNAKASTAIHEAEAILRRTS